LGCTEPPSPGAGGSLYALSQPHTPDVVHASRGEMQSEPNEKNAGKCGKKSGRNSSPGTGLNNGMGWCIKTTKAINKTKPRKRHSLPGIQAVEDSALPCRTHRHGSSCPEAHHCCQTARPVVVFLNKKIDPHIQHIPGTFLAVPFPVSNPETLFLNWMHLVPCEAICSLCVVVGSVGVYGLARAVLLS
jgi:hypothetical protein